MCTICTYIPGYKEASTKMQEHTETSLTAISTGTGIRPRIDLLISITLRIYLIS